MMFFHARKCFILAFYLILAGIFIPSQTVATNHVSLCSDANYVGQIRKLWNGISPELSKWAEGKGYVADGFVRSHPYELYDIQLHTINLLRYTAYCNDRPILDSLLTLYSKCFVTLQKSDKYHFFYYPGSPRLSVHNLNKKHLMWLNKEGQEIILYSSQFLYAVSEALVEISQVPHRSRSTSMVQFAIDARKILQDHYLRWCFEVPGPFQVRGWGCKNNGKYVESGLSHYEFLKRKKQFALGDKNSPSYCNAVTDTDMWIITGVANLLTSALLDPDLIRLSNKDYDRYLEYLKTGINLLRSRLSYIDLKNFDGKPVRGVEFDLGAWDDQPDRKYTGYVGHSYPAGDILTHLPKPTKTSWDISHARRYVDVFVSLVRDADILGLKFPGRYLLECLANQFVYRIFDGNFKRPLFSNFWSGANGWYRVGYNKREGFGYGPNDLSIAALSGGYAYLAYYNNDLMRLYARLYKMLMRGSEEENQWLADHFSGNRYKRYQRFSLPIFNGAQKNNQNYRKILLLDFLPAMCRMCEPFFCMSSDQPRPENHK